ncbi:Gfo/Idh/MocA family protein [Bacillus sp. 1P06AnD]|uniref:Gfo/Idh/MocA family protein n=1 Tax=Bacillus sp. 1P06AnD TaxID=3132208 RepID=UPI00399F5325
MTEKLKVGIIGAGGIALSRHLPSLAALGELAEMAGVCDLNKDKAEAAAKSFQIPFMTDNYHALFEKVDAVVISTPNKFHAELTIAALQAGLHVLCEKPMALNELECERMLDAAQKAKKTLAIGYHYRFMKEAQGAKKLMDRGIVGNPLVVRVQALRRRMMPNWGVFTSKELQGGGSLMDYGCHLLDLAMWLTGYQEPIEVSGRAYNALGKAKDQVNQWGPFDHSTFEVDDHVTAYITFKNGLSLLLETSWLNNISEEVIETVSISGDRGGLSVFPLTTNYTQDGMMFNNQAVWIPGQEEAGLAQMRNFLRNCHGMEPLLVQPYEALYVTGLIEKIYKSSEWQRTVTIGKDDKE